MAEGVVGVLGLGEAVPGLEVGEAVEGGPQGARRVDLLVVGEVVAGQGLAQHGDHALYGGLELCITGAGVAVGGGIEARMVADHGPPGLADGPHGVVAGYADGRGGQALGEDLPAAEAEQSDEGVVAVDVPVEGGLSDAELVGDAGEGDGVEALLVGEGRGG